LNEFGGKKGGKGLKVQFSMELLLNGKSAKICFVAKPLVVLDNLCSLFEPTSSQYMLVCFMMDKNSFSLISPS